jgi:glycosyltransferase involved in cell wall biosynthesis
MRTVVITTSYPRNPGDPSGHFVQADARDRAARGEQVTVLSPGAGGERDEIGPIHVVELGGASAFGWPGVLLRLRDDPRRAVSIATWLGRVRRHVSTHDYDQTIVHWPLPTAFVLPLERTGTRTFVSHGSDVRLLMGLPTPLRTRAVEAICARASNWQFVSASLLEQLASSLPRDVRAPLESIAHVCACAVEWPGSLRQRGSDRPGTGARRRYASVGRLIRSKGVDRALRYVHEVDPTAELVVVGDGPERRRLEEMARALRVDAHFVGLVPRVAALDYIQAADAVLFASTNEGLSTVLREAEHLGTPVLFL